MIQQTDIKANTDKLIEFVCRKMEAGELDNSSLLELFKVSGTYLNLETIPDYAQRTGLGYQGVKIGRRIETIFGVKFVIENI